MLAEFEKDLKEIEVNEKRIKKHLKSKNYSKKVLRKISKKVDKYDAKIKLLDNIKFVGHKILRIRFDANKFIITHYIPDKRFKRLVMIYLNYFIEKG
jgi:hypothetical protein